MEEKSWQLTFWWLTKQLSIVAMLALATAVSSKWDYSFISYTFLISLWVWLGYIMWRYISWVVLDWRPWEITKHK